MAEHIIFRFLVLFFLFVGSQGSQWTRLAGRPLFMCLQVNVVHKPLFTNDVIENVSILQLKLLLYQKLFLLKISVDGGSVLRLFTPPGKPTCVLEEIVMFKVR